MAKQLIQCIPNFSEGRRKDVIEAIVEPFRKTQGCGLLDYRADDDHNRLVVTIVGEAAPVQQALLDAASVAIENIDMNQHRGGHPRVGAVDVIPFVPLTNITLAHCVELAHDFARRYHERTGVPVYFYEEAALRPERKRLEVVRKGQYEILKTQIAKPERHPDIGEPCLHVSAGATVIGARKFLIAFNVNLGTDNLSVAEKIADAVRSSSGGFCHVKGLGLALKERGLVQVSMNIVDYEKNALYRIVELIRVEAKRWGVSIIATQVYGMVPAAALLDSTAYYLQIEDFDPNQVIELRLLDMLRDGE